MIMAVENIKEYEGIVNCTYPLQLHNHLHQSKNETEKYKQLTFLGQYLIKLFYIQYPILLVNSPFSIYSPLVLILYFSHIHLNES